jgi:putative ABC transport system substrate-binding protein
MKRRTFITLLGGGAVAWPLAARAQQAGKLPTIGFLGASAASVQSQHVAAFVQRLRELGWIDGRTVGIEVRWAEGRSVIPIVFTAADPVGSGLVAGLARPGGNVTGLSVQAPDLAGKRLELLREVVPGLRRLGILTNVDYPAAVLEMGEAQAAARTLGLEVATLEIRNAKNIIPAFETLKGGADALYVCVDPVLSARRISINTLANVARLPTITGLREYVEAGSLMSYGPSVPDLFRCAADYVDKILRGAKPGELPVEQPTKFDLIINLTTAKALGLAIREPFLLRADEVIE